MGLRFYRRVHLCPGLSVNLSRSGPSLTLGVRGAHVTLGRDRITKTVGLPGTGIFYTSRQGTHTGYHSARHDAPVTPDVQAAASLLPSDIRRYFPTVKGPVNGAQTATTPPVRPSDSSWGVAK
ncbi:MAG: DUF4236 domain-containing protein [Acidobacteriia bacterium]|nr:DUF4236 domain-containing protein [Terriglobia bacterium]